jgi:hypothetical protein
MIDGDFMVFSELLQDTSRWWQLGNATIGQLQVWGATAIPQQSNPVAPYFRVDHLLVFTQGRLNPSDEHAMLL